MNSETTENSSMDSPAIYQIIIKGKLTDHWADWFNGTMISNEYNSEGKPHTVLTCKVRDQAELLGILNKLYSLNLPLLQVMVTEPKL
jgi:hypothetical protein